MNLFPEGFTPSQINAKIGSSLMRDPFQTIRFDRENVHTWWQSDDFDDDLPASQIRGKAERHRDYYRKAYPSNIFRKTSEIKAKDKWSYYFEWELTPAGYLARECSLAHQCCDQDGCLDGEATRVFWLRRLSNFKAYHSRERVAAEMAKIEGWINEPWATPILRTFEILTNEHLAINHEGVVDYALTLEQFKSLIDSHLLIFKDYFFAKNDDWARPFQEHIMVVFLSYSRKQNA